MLVEKSTFLDCTMQQCLDQVAQPRLLEYVSWPMVCFSAIDPPALPERWEERKYLVKVRLFGFIPIAEQTVNISIPSTDTSRIELRDNGYSALITRWDHRIIIEPAPAGVHYTDRVEIHAGLLTPLVWAFAWIFYRHRQQRWKQLVENDFAYSSNLKEQS